MAGVNRTVVVTDRGRPVAVLVQAMPRGLERLEREGLLRMAEGVLVGVAPFELPPRATPPSREIAAGRAD